MSRGATKRPEAAGICTGGKRARDATHILHLRHRMVTEGAGAVGEDLVAGGPLDAPELMPAGACTSTEWTDGARRPIATETRTRRA